MASVQSVIRRFEGQIGNANAAALQAEYTSVIRPAYVRRYGAAGGFPGAVDIDTSNFTYNGNGGWGYVQVSMGVVNQRNPALRTFALAHETGHGVARLEITRVGQAMRNPYSPANATLNEYIADLIAMRVLMQSLPHLASGIIQNLGPLAAALGAVAPDHPSGLARVQLIRQLYFGASFGQLIASLAGQQT